MIRYKPVSINKLSFALCRYSVAIMLWLVYFLHSKLLLFIVGFIFLFSVIFKVKKAPLIILGNYTLVKLFKGNEVLVNEKAIFFAHLLGLFFSMFCIGIIFFIPYPASWLSVAFFATLKSISAAGFCPASKLYECIFDGNCCINPNSK